MKHFGKIDRKDVVDSKTYARYVQQKLGVPYPTVKNLVILNKAIKDIFEEYPHINYDTLCNLVDWAKAKNKKFAETYSLVSMYRYAWKDGFLPELDPVNAELEDFQSKEDELLAKETDPYWRNKIISAQTLEAKQQIYDLWKGLL